MKRLLLVCVLAVALLALLAAPALAWQPPETMQPGNAYVGVMSEVFGNYWYDLDASGTPVFHDGTEAIPSGDHVWLSFGWGSPIRGTIQNFPSHGLYGLEVSGPEGYSWSISQAASKQQWSVLYNGGPGPAFNKASTTIWVRDWYVDLGVLGVGTYSGKTTETYTRPVTDSSFMYDPWVKHEQQRPIKVPPGTNHYTFAFTMGP
jgi:opacity protein-like surface antigen